MGKKARKRILHAEMVWERDRIKAALMKEQLEKSIAVFNMYKDSFIEEEIVFAEQKIAERQQDIRDFVEAAKQKYLNKLQEAVGRPKLAETGDSTSDTLKGL